MPVTLTAIGIQSTSIALVESFDLEKRVDLKSINASDGGFGAAETQDPVFEFTISGRGDLPAALALGVATSEDLPITPLSAGVTIINRIREGQKNDDFQSWETGGMNFPGAS